MIEKYKFAEVPEEIFGYKAIVVRADYYVFTRPNEIRILNTHIKKDLEIFHFSFFQLTKKDKLIFIQIQ